MPRSWLCVRALLQCRSANRRQRAEVLMAAYGGVAARFACSSTTGDRRARRWRATQRGRLHAEGVRVCSRRLAKRSGATAGPSPTNTIAGRRSARDSLAHLRRAGSFWLLTGGGFARCARLRTPGYWLAHLRCAEPVTPFDRCRRRSIKVAEPTLMARGLDSVRAARGHVPSRDVVAHE